MVIYYMVSFDFDFDWEYYINKYDDLKNAGINTKEEAWNHWITSGIKEGRNSDPFDWEYYINKYEDLQNAGINTKEAAWNHWLISGKNEGRNSNSFNWEHYINKYEDLQNAGINTKEAAWNHWITSGKNEGRNSDPFDWEYYINKYDDLRNAGINTKEAAWNHWITSGKNEGRIFNNFKLVTKNYSHYINTKEEEWKHWLISGRNSDHFDWEYYINKYDDLRNAGINTKEEAWNHWITNGIKEGRIFNKFILVKKNYTHYVNVDINMQIDIDRVENYNLYIVYFINCLVNTNYMDWLVNQLNLVKDFGGTIYIVSTIVQSDEITFRQNVNKLFSNVNIECHYENEFEYRGILKVWELGQIHNNANDIILYFHSKGVTHNKSYKDNAKDSYNIILKDINRIKEIFTIFPQIDKIGYSSGGCGWIWYNFWYVRGSYINQVERPIKIDRRHYYEDWLARKVDINDKICENERPFSHYKNSLINCYGFYTHKNIIGNIGSYFDSNNNKYYTI